MGQIDVEKDVRIWISAELRRLLKGKAGILGRTMTDCLNEAVREWLIRQEKVELEAIREKLDRHQPPATDA